LGITIVVLIDDRAAIADTKKSPELISGKMTAGILED
jgi:hypothetical protein